MRRTEFEIVRRPSPARWGRRGAAVQWLAVAVAMAVAGGVAANTLIVQPKRDTTALFAERYDIPSSFLVQDSSFFPAHEPRDARGVEGLGAEMTSSLNEARTTLKQDRWVYRVTVKEAAPDEIKGGNFTVQLYVDEASMGVLHVKQEFRESDKAEGVTALFDVGTHLLENALYYVVVKPFVLEGPVVERTLRTVANDTWIGVGAPIEGVTNPTLTLTAGTNLRLTAVHGGEKKTHNLGILDEDGKIVEPPGWSDNLEKDVVESDTIAWKATVGTFTYACKYHPDTMKGTLNVT